MIARPLAVVATSGIVGPEVRLADGERPPEERLRRQAVAAIEMRDGEVVEAGGDRQRLRPELTLADRERSPVHRFGLVVLRLNLERRTEVVEHVRDREVVASERLLANRQRAAERGLGRRIVAADPLQIAQMVEAGADFRVHRTQVLLAQGEGLGERLLGGLVQLELLVDTPDGVEQASPRQRLAVEPGAELSGAAVEQLARRDRAAARRSRIVDLEEVDQELDDLRRFGLRLARRCRFAVGALRLEGARRDAARERQDHDAGRDDGGPVAARELPEDVEAPWPAGQDRLETAIPLDVVRQLGGRVVTHLALPGGRLERDPVQVAAQ